jgi:signal peptidase I
MKRRRWLLYLLLLLVPLSGCDSGDRVLVAKFLTDSGLAPLNRYDVVVFKYPQTPIENGTPKNYIKRLLGLPGELIAIFFGRLYRYSPEKGLPPNVSEQEWKQFTSTADRDPLDLWRYPPKNEDTAKRLWAAGTFEILRKPPSVILALSRPVYDNDHQAKDLKAAGFPDRWSAHGGSAWAADGPTGFKHPGSGTAEEWVHYRHILRPPGWSPAMGAKRTFWPQLITDFLGYNTYEIEHGGHGTPPGNWAGDLMLECKLTVEQPQGEFWMEVSRGIDRFQARFDLASGVCTLYRLQREGDKVKLEQLAKADTAVKAAGEYALRFANYDDRLTVWVNRDLPFGDGHAYAPLPHSQMGPDREMDKRAWDRNDLDDIRNNDLQPASFCSLRAPVRVQAIKLWRDTYYSGFNRDGMIVCDWYPSFPSRDDPPISGEQWSHADQWEPLHKLEAKTIYIYPGHYLCLGDNSQESSDSRQWGLVPERLMLGRALMVYFPLNRAGRIK